MGQDDLLRSFPTLCFHDTDFLSEKQILTFYRIPCFLAFLALYFKHLLIVQYLHTIPLFFTSLLMQSSARNCFLTVIQSLMPFMYQIWDFIS